MKFSLPLLLLLAVFFVGLPAHAQIKKKAPAKGIIKNKKAVKQRINKTKNVHRQPAADTASRVKIITSMGEIIIKLYDKTPLHKNNFLKLVKEHFYDSLLFHRVINTFMIQGGDPLSKRADSGEMLGNGDVGYTIPAEFDSTLFHKRGALCAARTDNPEKGSSGCQFYIVQGKPAGGTELDMIEVRNGIKYTPAQRMTYKMNGGTPRLDGNYTVFGEVESGMDVVDKIALAAKDGSKRPLEDIRMRMELLPAAAESLHKK